jgi:hypothetical protein
MNRFACGSGIGLLAQRAPGSGPSLRHMREAALRAGW